MDKIWRKVTCELRGNRAMSGNSTSILETVSKTIQLVSLVVGVVVSIWSFNSTRQKEAEARVAEARRQQTEAAKPFLEMRQKRYMEVIHIAAVLASPDGRQPGEIETAQRRFWELYWAELSMVEGVGVESSMVALGRALKPNLRPTPVQRATLDLAHTLRDSLIQSWGVDERTTGRMNP